MPFTISGFRKFSIIGNFRIPAVVFLEVPRRGIRSLEAIFVDFERPDL